MTNQAIFLGFVVSSQGVSADPQKVQVIIVARALEYSRCKKFSWACNLVQTIYKRV